MALVTRAARDKARDDAAWEKTCPCGHPEPAHHNLMPVLYSVVDGVFTETPNPAYDGNEWHCDDKACPCVRVSHYTPNGRKRPTVSWTFTTKDEVRARAEAAG